MKLTLTYILLLLSFGSFAQLQRNYASYTVDDGLAQNTVWDAYQDYKGYMWFGTADGMNRFDGHTMHHYKWNSKDSSTIIGNTAFKFYEDAESNLWISHNKGVSIYNRKKDCFKNVLFNSVRYHGTGEHYASILGEDKKGRIWTTSGNQELIAVSKKSYQVEKRFRITTSEYNVSSIRTSVVSGNYIIGYLNDSSTSWFRFNLETDKLETIHGPANYTGYFMLYNDSTICCFDKHKIYYYNVNQNLFTSHTIQSNNLLDGFNMFMASCLVWWQGKIYLGNNLGLFVFNTKTNSFEERITSFNKGEKVSFYYIQFLRVDRSGNLWICTNGDGVKCLSPYRNKFEHYNSHDSRNKLVKSICTDSSGTIYTGLFAEGIITYKPNGTIEQYKFGKAKDESTHVLAQTFWKNRYYVVNDRHLRELNPTTKKEIWSYNVFHFKNFGYCAYPFFHHYKNKLYLCCDVAVYEIKEKEKPAQVFQFNNLDTMVTTMCIINDTTWWIGSTKTIFCYNPKTKKWKKLPISLYTKTICLTQNRKEVWVGSHAGLYKMSLDGHVIQKIDFSDGLPDDFIYGILEDKAGRLWMSHNKGISVYTPLTKKFKHYGIKDGLQSNEFNTGAYYKDNNGLLYLGGVNGINIINPNNIITNKNLPKVSINSIFLDDSPYITDTAYNELKTLTLPYFQNTLSFDFSALEFSQVEGNTYQYYLEGYDDKWIESGKLHFARYANLPPGDYTFKVKAANGDGLWNETPHELSITIVPPFWQRTWFYWLMGVFGFAVIGGAFYVYNKRQQLKLKQKLEVQQQLEQERLRISRDLHDNVGAQLSYLITNVEWMLQHPDRLTEQDEQQRLQAMSEAGRNAILTLRQTIWAISHNSLNADDFADRFKQFALKMVEFNKNIHLYFTEQLLPNQVLSPALALHLFRICQEAFNNCLKHAQCKNIIIHFESTENCLFQFSIKDDGIGFDWEQAKKKGHYGLVNMEARAKETNACFQVNSAIGKGTEIVITLK